ncbi:hypothetical protein MRX96_037691 [Rhipicephalus microplus]
MVHRRLELVLCWCALVAAVGYGHLLVDRSAKQRVQALLAHSGNPISALRTSAPVSPLARHPPDDDPSGDESHPLLLAAMLLPLSQHRSEYLPITPPSPYNTNITEIKELAVFAVSTPIRSSVPVQYYSVQRSEGDSFNRFTRSHCTLQNGIIQSSRKFSQHPTGLDQK